MGLVQPLLLVQPRSRGSFSLAPPALLWLLAEPCALRPQPPHEPPFDFGIINWFWRCHKDAKVCIVRTFALVGRVGTRPVVGAFVVVRIAVYTHLAVVVATVWHFAQRTNGEHNFFSQKKCNIFLEHFFLEHFFFAPSSFCASAHHVRALPFFMDQMQPLVRNIMMFAMLARQSQVIADQEQNSAIRILIKDLLNSVDEYREQFGMSEDKYLQIKRICEVLKDEFADP